MRTRLTLVVLIAVGIFGGILLEESRSAYAQVERFALVVERRSRPNIQGLPMISITRDGSLYLNEKPVSIKVLVEELKRNFPTASEVYIRPDKTAVWDPISQVLIALKAANPPIQAKFALPESKSTLVGQ